MITKQTIYCPNCGDRNAQRHKCSETNILRTSCYNCDYLLVQCSKTAKVIEAYAPGIDFIKSQVEPQKVNQNGMLATAHKQR